MQNNNKYLLVIDDNEDLLYTVRDYLELMGYKVDTAVSVEEVRRSITRNYSLIITDVMLDNESGFDVLKISKDFNKNTPVIFITGNFEVFSKDSRLADVYSTLKKPFSLSELSKTVNDALN